MQIRPLGATGLDVTPLGLGLAAVGRPAYINLGRDEDLGQERSVEALRGRSHELLDEAWRLGIRYVDVARSYGRAEEFLASWVALRPALAAEMTIGSKWGYTYVGEWRLDAAVHEVKDHSLATLRQQLGESRGLLGSRLALYQVHSATLESGVLEDAAILGELARLREGGLTIGLTVSGPRQAEVVGRALEVRVDGRSPFGCVQATWNLLERSVGRALEEAHEAGWGVIVKEALANGRLAGSGAPSAVAAIAGRAGVGADAVALAAVLANSWVDVALSGAATVGQLRSNAAAATVELGAGELDELGTLAEDPERYWRTRSELAWA